MPGKHSPRGGNASVGQRPGSQRDQDALPDDAGDDDPGLDSTPLAQAPYREAIGEQADFREHFDEDLYNDREEAPAQGNTADVAMGEHRFGSDAEAYAEYAHRRPGEDSAVGQSRDPADIAEGADDADEDEDEDDVLP